MLYEGYSLKICVKEITLSDSACARATVTLPLPTISAATNRCRAGCLGPYKSTRDEQTPFFF